MRNPESYREIDGRGIVFAAPDRLHACEAVPIDPEQPSSAMRLIWTLCHHDVPANGARLIEPPGENITCRECRAAIAG